MEVWGWKGRRREAMQAWDTNGSCWRLPYRREGQDKDDVAGETQIAPEGCSALCNGQGNVFPVLLP